MLTGSGSNLIPLRVLRDWKALYSWVLTDLLVESDSVNNTKKQGEMGVIFSTVGSIRVSCRGLEVLLLLFLLGEALKVGEPGISDVDTDGLVAASFPAATAAAPLTPIPTPLPVCGMLSAGVNEGLLRRTVDEGSAPSILPTCPTFNLEGLVALATFSSAAGGELRRYVVTATSLIDGQRLEFLLPRYQPMGGSSPLDCLSLTTFESLEWLSLPVAS